MNFELWAWGDGINADFSDRVVVKGWDAQPAYKMIDREIGWFLGVLEFDEVGHSFDGDSSVYEVLKDGVWKRVYFMLWEI